MRELNEFSNFISTVVEAGKITDYDKASKDFYDYRAKKLGKTASELMTTSGGQFVTRADRLNQDKVDAALGPGFKAGSKEANLALAQKFRGQQPQLDQPGQGAKPTPGGGVASAVKGAENLTPYSTAADVAGLSALGAAAGQFLPKVGGTIAKAVPGLNVAYQGADALRRASLGDVTGSAISAAGAVPALGIPAIAAQAVRDKYRTGSFFPSDEELKTAVDRDRGVAPTPATKSEPQAATPKLKEGNKQMNKKQLKKRLEKLEETKIQMVQGMHDRAVAEGKIDAAARFAKMLRGLGGGAEALPASTIRKGGQTFDKVRGVDSELKYFNPATRDVKSLDDIKNIGNKPPAVWRKGGDAGATTTATKTATKAGGAADDVASAAAKGGKPLSRTASTLAGAAGGALIGYGLGMGGDDKKPEPDPGPGPEPGPRPTPPKPTPDKDQIRGPAHGPGGEEQAQYTDLINKEFSKDKDSDNSRSDSTTDKDSLADRYGADSYVAKVAEGLDDLRRLAGLAKK